MRLQSLRYAEMFSVHQFSDPAIKDLPVKYYAIAKKSPLGPELCSVLVLALAPADNTSAAFSFENGFKYTLRMLHERSWEPLRSPQSIQQYLLGFSKSLRTIRPAQFHGDPWTCSVKLWDPMQHHALLVARPGPPDPNCTISEENGIPNHTVWHAMYICTLNYKLWVISDKR